MTTDPAPVADAGAEGDGRRFPGVQSFGETDRERFFGRSSVTQELMLRVLSVRLLLQFAPSGVGKTSVLQAGLFPLLRPYGLFPFTVRLNRADETFPQALRRSMAEAAERCALPEPTIPPATSSAIDLLSRTRLWSEDLTLLTPVLVFDQFEEVFTLRDDAFRRDMAQQLSALVGARAHSPAEGQARPSVKIIFSLREEFLGRLDEFSREIPELFHERLRLEPLSREEARDAMARPAALGGEQWRSPRFEFSASCLEELLDFIDGASERAPLIEPLTLQLVCRHAEDLVMRAQAAHKPQRALEITDFGGIEGLRRLVEDYFRVELARLKRPGVRARAREMFERGMLDPSGKRLMLEEGEIVREYRLDRDHLELLVGGRLLRREPRNDSLFYEISHDRLAEAIFRQRRARLPRWVVRTLAGSAVAVLCAIALVGYVNRERSRAEKAYALLLGDTVVTRLLEAGSADALSMTLDQIEQGRARAEVPPAALKLRHQGELLFDRGGIGDARDKLQQALTLLDSNSKDLPAPVARERSRVLTRLGDVEVETGHAAQAQQYFDAATALSGIALRANPEDGYTDRMDAAELLLKRGLLAMSLGDYEAADSLVSEALDHIVRAWPMVYVPSSVERPGMGFQQGRLLQIMTDALMTQKNLRGTAGIPQGTLIIAEEAGRRSPFSARALHLLVRAYADLAVTDLGSANALDATSSAADKVSRLVQFDPDNLFMRREQAAVQLLRAEHLAACSEASRCGAREVRTRLADSMLRVKEVQGDLRWLSSTDPERMSWRVDLAWALRVEGLLHAALGDFSKAVIAYAAARSQLASLEGAWPAFDTQSRIVEVEMDHMSTLAKAGREIDALAVMAEAEKALDQMPKGGVATKYMRYTMLDRQEKVFKAFRQGSQSRLAGERRDALVQDIEQLGNAMQRRAHAANERAVALINETRKEGGKPALQHYQEVIRLYREAIAGDPGVAVYWDNLRIAHQWEIDSLDDAAIAQKTDALVAAVAAAEMAHVLGARDTKSADYRQALYEARRNLALHYYNLGRHAVAQALARDGLFQSHALAQAGGNSEAALEQLRDSYYGVGLTRNSSRHEGWEEPIRVAIAHGSRLLGIRKRAQDAHWLGEVHLELARQLEEKGRADDARTERAAANARCRQARSLPGAAQVGLDLDACLERSADTAK